MKTMLKIILILVVLGMLSMCAMIVLPMAGVYFLAKDKDVQEFTKNMGDKEKVRNALDAGIEKAMEKPVVKEAVEQIADGLANSTRINYIHYLPEQDMISFRVEPDTVDMNGVSLGIYSETDTEKPLFTLPIQPLGDVAQPVVAKMDKSEPFLRDVTGTEVINGQTGEKSYEKFALVYTASAEGIPAGRYKLKLENVQNAPGNYFASYTMPEKQSILKVIPLTTEPVNTTVGSTFDYNFYIENSSVIPAKDVTILVYVRNQRLQASNPEGIKRVEGDKTFITFPEVPAKGQLPVALRFDAIAADDDMYFSAEPENSALLHPSARKAVMGSRIGKVSGGAVTPSTEDPSTTLVLKRSDFCRAKAGPDEAAVQECIKVQAKEDFGCLKKPTPAEQRDCIAAIYGQ